MSTLTTAIYGVNGMTCGHCVSAVTSEVSALPGVSQVHVDLDAATVTVESEQPLDPAAVAAAIDEAGYEVR
jgi:copper ion binding protein